MFGGWALGPSVPPCTVQMTFAAHPSITAEEMEFGDFSLQKCRAREQQGWDSNPDLSAPTLVPLLLVLPKASVHHNRGGGVKCPFPVPAPRKASAAGWGRQGGLRNMHFAQLPEAMLGQGVGNHRGRTLLISVSQGHLCILCVPPPTSLSFLICEVRGWTRSKVISKVIPGVCRVP